ALVLALPRGGVPVAFEVARELKLPLDVLLVKKIGAPMQPEFAIGAVSEDKEPVWNYESLAYMNLSQGRLQELADETHEKILQQLKKWRQGRAPLSVVGK